MKLYNYHTSHDPELSTLTSHLSPPPPQVQNLFMATHDQGTSETPPRYAQYRTELKITKIQGQVNSVDY